MIQQQRRLRTLELALTPKQIVALWLKNAQAAGSFEEGATRLPSPRESVAKAVSDCVSTSMKGQPELLIEQAIQQARREADFLYLLIIKANVEVLENLGHRARDFRLFRAYFHSLIRRPQPKEICEEFRAEVRQFVEQVLVLDAAASRIAAERLDGQIILFHDTCSALELQREMAKMLFEFCNFIVAETGAAELNLKQVHESLGSGVDRQISIWDSLARVEMLAVYGESYEFVATAQGIIQAERREASPAE